MSGVSTLDDKYQIIITNNKFNSNWLLDKVNLFNKKVKNTIYKNIWNNLLIRNNNLHEQLPMLFREEWYNESLDFECEYNGKIYNSISGFLYFTRIQTNDCLFEIPTINSLELLNRIFQQCKTRIILSPFSGIGLYEKKISDNGYYIIATDDYNSHKTSNKNARQIETKQMEFNDSIKFWMEADTLLCIWSPNINILEIASNYKNIEQVIFIGDHNLCGHFTHPLNKKKGGYLHKNFTCEYIGKGGVGHTDYYSNHIKSFITNSEIYLCKRK